MQGAYLVGHAGKKLHDPLALAVALDESVCTLVEVQLDSRGPDAEQWGSWQCAGSNTWISVDYDEAKFKATLLRDGFSLACQDARVTAASASEPCECAQQ